MWKCKVISRKFCDQNNINMVAETAIKKTKKSNILWRNIFRENLVVSLFNWYFFVFTKFLSKHNIITSQYENLQILLPLGFYLKSNLSGGKFLHFHNVFCKVKKFDLSLKQTDPNVFMTIICPNFIIWRNIFH